jgi:acyl-CoA hydrolase
MALPHSPTRLDSIESCVDAILARVGKHIKLGLPVGIGKPNVLVNALVQRAIADPTIRLTIFTALSLRRPRGRSTMERRFIEPFARRVFGNYPELDYVTLLAQNKLPSNIEVSEFFLEPGAWLTNTHLQQNYLSANYTHVVRDLCQRGLNVVAQLIAPPPAGQKDYSLSTNPDLTVDLLPYFREQRAQGKPCLFVGQVHRKLPYMYGDALLAPNEFDIVLDDVKTDFTLFCPPNMPIGTADYAIALNVSALVKDGGTLQLGIGELGDAIVYGLKLRHEQPATYRDILQSSGLLERHASLMANIGGAGAFDRGLYGCSEMLVDGFIDLYRAGILKRRVYPHALLQRLIDDGKIGEEVNASTLQALRDAGLEVLTRKDFEQLQTAGVIRNDVRYESAIDNLLPLLGARLRSGVLAHGGFFFGPKAFYAALRDMPEHERCQFEMQRISFINELYGEDQALKIAQRRHARFINTTMMVTGLGAAVSDGLANGSMVSGVGGQYNFVAMAHALPDARSILCVRSTRTSKGEVRSNIVWNYGHITIPRHLRDIVVTEYGVADLRGKTDAEVVMALIEVMDARFQAAFVAEAQRTGKLPAGYLVPEHARANTPERLENIFKPWRQRGLFGELPFGGDFTDEELVLAKALKQLQADTATTSGRIHAMLQALFSAAPDATMQPYLKRMQLERPATFSERLEQRALTRALRKTTHQ